MAFDLPEILAGQSYAVMQASSAELLLPQLLNHPNNPPTVASFAVFHQETVSDCRRVLGGQGPHGQAALQSHQG